MLWAAIMRQRIEIKYQKQNGYWLLIYIIMLIIPMSTKIWIVGRLWGGCPWGGGFGRGGFGCRFSGRSGGRFGGGPRRQWYLRLFHLVHVLRLRALRVWQRSNMLTLGWGNMLVIKFKSFPSLGSNCLMFFLLLCLSVPICQISICIYQIQFSTELWSGRKMIHGFRNYFMNKDLQMYAQIGFYFKSVPFRTTGNIGHYKWKTFWACL